jgi:hypothetical protein
LRIKRHVIDGRSDAVAAARPRRVLDNQEQQVNQQNKKD